MCPIANPINHFTIEARVVLIIIKICVSGFSGAGLGHKRESRNKIYQPSEKILAYRRLVNIFRDLIHHTIHLHHLWQTREQVSISGTKVRLRKQVSMLDMGVHVTPIFRGLMQGITIFINTVSVRGRRSSTR